MKNRIAILLGLIFATMIVTAAPTGTNNEPQGRAPVLDAQGRFWVYRNGRAHPPMPFIPYGWMSDTSNNLGQLISIDMECRDNPHREEKTGGPPERESCIRVKFTWDSATWISVAFIAGSDKPAWWGDSPGGTHYNLSSLPKKRLVFYARGQNGGEMIKAQIGVLTDKPFGDSLSKPVVSDEIQLGTEWKRYEVDLKDVPTGELSAVCNGFGLFAERASQSGTANEIQFFVDDVYFE